MAIQRFKVSLNAARFPLVSTKGQRAVFIPGLDSAPRTPRTFMGSNESVDFDMAQILYGENVMPVSEGLKSVGYSQLIAPTVNTDFDQIFALRDDAENTVLYAPAAGKNYIYDNVTSAWTTTSFLDIHGILIDPSSPNTEATAQITYAYVDGKTFVCYSRLLKATAQPAVITGTFDNITAFTLTVQFMGVLYTLGVDPQLSTADSTWFLDISSLTFAYGIYPIVTTTTDVVPVTTTVTTYFTYAATDASILFWNPTTKSLEPAGALIANMPFAAGTIDGISSSNGYLVVYSDISVAWAAFNGTAFDYTIYANGEFTGSGSQIPEDVQGKIKACIGLPGGFVIFTAKNAIAATYHAQSIAAPWVFREIAGAGGIESYEQATVEGSLGALIAYTTTGLQKVSLNSSEEAYPDVSDFIADRYIERYSFGTQLLTQSSTTLDMFVKISNIANRYLVVSYGTYPKVFSFALVYDMTLQRWGKLRIVHRDCFYYNYGAITADLTYSMLGDIPYNYPGLGTYDSTTQQSNAIVAAQHGLAFLKEDGSVLLADWSSLIRDTEDEAVAILGRIQLTRTSHSQFNRAEIEGMTSGRVYLQPSYDGRTLGTAIPLTDIEVYDRYRIVGDMVDCKNFNLVIEGTFDLSTMIIEATTSGKI
jgi:hypothetical protein